MQKLKALGFEADPPFLNFMKLIQFCFLKLDGGIFLDIIIIVVCRILFHCDTFYLSGFFFFLLSSFLHWKFRREWLLFIITGNYESFFILFRKRFFIVCHNCGVLMIKVDLVAIKVYFDKILI